jgi:hypothetical protein
MRLRGLLATSLASSLSLFPGRAHAQSPAAPPEAAPQRIWYGWQTLVTDGAGLALLFAGAGVYDAAGGSSSTGTTGGTTGLIVLLTGGVGLHLAAPIVHWAHGHVGIGLASLGLRIFLPLAGGYAVTGGDLRNASGFVAGNLAGLAACSTLDAAAFAYDEAPAPRDTPSAGLPFVPQVAVTHQGFSAGFSRAF